LLPPPPLPPPPLPPPPLPPPPPWLTDKSRDSSSRSITINGTTITSLVPPVCSSPSLDFLSTGEALRKKLATDEREWITKSHKSHYRLPVRSKKSVTKSYSEMDENCSSVVPWDADEVDNRSVAEEVTAATKPLCSLGGPDNFTPFLATAQIVIALFAIVGNGITLRILAANPSLRQAQCLAAEGSSCRGIKINKFCPLTGIFGSKAYSPGIQKLSSL
jgi:hypothetical protein